MILRHLKFLSLWPAPRTTSPAQSSPAPAPATPRTARTMTTTPRSSFQRLMAFLRREPAAQATTRRPHHVVTLHPSPVKGGESKNGMRLSMSALGFLQETVTADILGETPSLTQLTVHPRGKAPESESVQVQTQLLLDLPRMRVRIGPPDSPEIQLGMEASGGSSKRDDVHQAVEAMRHVLGSAELLAAVSRVAHQGPFAAVQKLLASRHSPVLAPDGQPSLIQPQVGHERLSVAIERAPDGRGKVTFNYVADRCTTLIPAKGHFKTASGKDREDVQLDPSASAMRASFSVLVHQNGGLEVEEDASVSAHYRALSR